jgi:citrate synthase
MYGDLPSAKQLTDFEDEITENMHYSSKKLNAILHAYNEDSHPMGIIVGAMSQLATHLHNDNLSLIAKKDIEGLRAHAKIAIAKMLTIVPAVARHIKNQEPIELDDKLSPVENFLYTMFGVKPTASAVIALDKLFILHADHEQNASTSAVRSVGSTGVDLFASICAGVCALWGPLHGGANEEVINMLHNISDISDVANYIEKVKKGEAKLMGFGHRVYKNYDPRASVIKKYADDVLKNINNSSSAKMLQIAMNIEQQALSEQYFIQRKLFPNVDFYSGIIYAAMGIETKMFTPMFAAGRISGWVSQWLEMVSGSEKISRPRQIYTGHVLRKI